MISQLMSLLGDYWMQLIGLGLLGLLAFWYFDERNDTDGASGTIFAVGERADNALAGVLGAASALILVVTSILSSIGVELAQTLGLLVDPIAQAPTLAGQLVTGFLSIIGLAGVVSMPLTAWVTVFAVILLAAVALRYRPT